MPVISHVRATEKVQFGTSVKVHLASQIESRGTARIVLLLRDYSMLNKHAEFSLDFFGKASAWERSEGSISKWTANNPDPIQWYDSRSFENLILATIQADRAQGKSQKVRDFVRRFAGFRRSDALKAVLDATTSARCNLSDMVDPRRVRSLLKNMTENSAAPNATKLGSIGKEQVKRFLGDGANYRRIAGETESGLPFVVEAAFADRDDGGDRRMISGINFAVDVRAPACREVTYLLGEQMIDECSATDMFFHLTTPSVKFTDRGKTEVETCSRIDSAVAECVRTVTKQYTARMKADERDANARVRRARKRAQTHVTLKDAIFEVMEASIETVSHGGTCDFSARNHYYAIRPLIQQFTSESLDQNYLDKVIDEWESLNGIIERRTRDPRGFLLEPHTRKQIPLGTRQVDEYSIPDCLYHTIIYVEKKGLLSTFQFGQIAEKYDAAIICAEGYAVRAAQSLMQSAATGHEIKVFVFHDADPSGYMIAKKIGDKSGAHQFDFEVIDAGLRIGDALSMGLATETFTRSQSLPKALDLTSQEQRLFGGEQVSSIGRNGNERNQWINCQRVELNALAATPSKFVAWVEMQLNKHGAKKKLVPSSATCKSQVKLIFEDLRRKEIRSEVLARLGVDAIVDRIDSALPTIIHSGVHAKIRTWASRLEPYAWKSEAENIAQNELAKLSDAIEAEIEKQPW